MTCMDASWHYLANTTELCDNYWFYESGLNEVVFFILLVFYGSLFCLAINEVFGGKTK